MQLMHLQTTKITRISRSNVRHLVDVAAAPLLPSPAHLLLPLATPIDADAAAYRHQQEEKDPDAEDKLVLVLLYEPHDGAGVAPVPFPGLFWADDVYSSQQTNTEHRPFLAEPEAKSVTYQ